MSKTILVIDDDSQYREVVEHILLDNGYDPAVVACPDEAFKLLADQQFDLIMCDLHMPFTLDEHMSEFQYSDQVGIKTLEELRWVFPELPILAVSSTPAWQLRKMIEEIPSVVALSKPFSSKALMSLIEVILQNDGCRQVH